MIARSADASYVVWFEELGKHDVPRVGGEMVQRLSSRGVRVPPGFATTSGCTSPWIRQSLSK
jgi:pyruvate,water dikinase